MEYCFSPIQNNTVIKQVRYKLFEILSFSPIQNNTVIKRWVTADCGVVLF